jgi:NADH-quinone oxidoreductase subunit N
MTLGCFLIVLQMRGSDGEPVETIASLSGMSRTRPGLAAAFGIFMFALAGIPPLLGFFSKLAVFDAATRAGLYPLAVIGIVGSVPGAYYYLKIVKTMYFDEAAPAYQGKPGLIEGSLIFLTALIISPVGMFGLPALTAWTDLAARSLF